MDRKQKREAKNARHRANTIRRIDRRFERMIAPIRPLIDDAIREQRHREFIEARCKAMSEAAVK